MRRREKAWRCALVARTRERAAHHAEARLPPHPLRHHPLRVVEARLRLGALTKHVQPLGARASTASTLADFREFAFAAFPELFTGLSEGQQLEKCEMALAANDYDLKEACEALYEGLLQELEPQPLTHRACLHEFGHRRRETVPPLPVL